MTTRRLPKGLCPPDEMLTGHTSGNVYRNEAAELADEVRACTDRIDGHLRAISCGFVVLHGRRDYD